MLIIDSVKNITNIVGILAGIGMIVGSLSYTGVGGAFSRELVQFAGSNVYLLLLFGAITSFILGMGMTVSACYIFLAVVLGPALYRSGSHLVASHLFILYWGMLSYITPPVALAAVAAATIANASPMKTGFLAMRLGIDQLHPAFSVRAEPDVDSARRAARDRARCHDRRPVGMADGFELRGQAVRRRRSRADCARCHFRGRMRRSGSRLEERSVRRCNGRGRLCLAIVPPRPVDGSCASRRGADLNGQRLSLASASLPPDPCEDALRLSRTSAPQCALELFAEVGELVGGEVADRPVVQAAFTPVPDVEALQGFDLGRRGVRYWRFAPRTG